MVKNYLTEYARKNPELASYPILYPVTRGSYITSLVLLLLLAGLVLVLALDLYPIKEPKYDTDRSIEAFVMWSSSIDQRLEALENPNK